MRGRGRHRRLGHDITLRFTSPPTGTLTARLTAFVTALVATLGIAVLTGCSATVGPAAGEAPAPVLPPTAEPSAEPPRVPSAAELPGQVISLDFSDEEHGFALLADCPDAPPYGCTYQVASYDGAAWRLVESPLPPVHLSDLDATIQAAGPGHARLAAVTHGSGLPSEAHAWLTTDDGGSWRTTDFEPSGTVDVIPEGALVGTASAVDGRLAVLLPDTAEYRLLDPQPPLDDLGMPGRLPDGRYWVPGLDADGEPAVVVWRAEGGGWRTLTPLPTAPEFLGSVSHRQLELALGPDGLYAFETGTARSKEGSSVQSGLYQGSLLGIYHSADDGRTWERVWTHVDASSRPGSVFGTPIAAADGTLVVYADDSIYVSEDGGSTFTISRPGPPPEEPALTRAGYLLTDLDHPGHYRISADGFSWHTIVLGSEDV